MTQVVTRNRREAVAAGRQRSVVSDRPNSARGRNRAACRRRAVKRQRDVPARLRRSIDDERISSDVCDHRRGYRPVQLDRIVDPTCTEPRSKIGRATDRGYSQLVLACNKRARGQRVGEERVVASISSNSEAARIGLI